ncbi:MAG: MBL fold metallo-hydrolase [Candidatus Helarchaeota archaeon]
MIKLTFLGTASGNFVPRRQFTSFLLSLPKEEILIDCGSKFILSHVNLRRLSKIFISHLHGDHILYLGALLRKLLRYNRSHQLTIYCPIGTKAIIRFILRLQIPITIPKCIIFNELNIRTLSLIEENEYTITGARADHLGPTICYAFKFNRKKVTFACDTTANYPNIIELAANSTYLIHEATYNSGTSKFYSKMTHSTAQGAGLDARLSNSEILIITHICTSRFKNTNQIIRESQREFKKHTIIPADLMALKL